MAMDKIKLLIVDDHPAFNKGLRHMLEEEEDLECVGQAVDGVSAIKLAKRLKPDVVLLDVSMPKLNGTQAAKEISKHCPNTAIIMLSAFDYEAFVLASLRAGARGYLLKTAPMEKIISAIRLVHKGGSVLDIKVTDKLVNHLRLKGSDVDRPVSNKMGFEMLHPRELEIIDLAAKGMSNKEIANELTISERTVQTHMVNIFRKLGATSRTQAVLYALRKGWIELDETHRTL
jgi:NarL family two-component system response regulator LiaR